MRLLGAGDPLLQARDRERLIPDAALRKRVWAPSGAPGVVLADGEVVALWRGRRKGRRLEVEVTPAAGALPPAVRAAIEAEAAAIAPLRGATSATVSCSG